MSEQLLQEIQSKFDLDALSAQLETVVQSGDPAGYLEHNINWEVDRDVDSAPSHEMLHSVNEMMSLSAVQHNYLSWHPFKKFKEWMEKSNKVKTVKRILCSIAAEIEKQIDEKAALSKIVQIAVLAVASAVGIAFISPVVLSIVVSVLATMILNGVNKFCGI